MLHNNLLSKVQVSAINHTKFHKELTKESLADLWSIGIETAERTLKATTQNHLRVNSGNLYRQFHTRVRQRQYNQLGGPYGRYCTDISFSKIVSTQGNTCSKYLLMQQTHCMLPHEIQE